MLYFSMQAFHEGLLTMHRGALHGDFNLIQSNYFELLHDHGGLALHGGKSHIVRFLASQCRATYVCQYMVP